MTETVNADQAAYWNAAAGPTWAELHDRLDRQLEPLGRAAMARLAPRPGERFLDVGCGAGQTTLALGEAVGAEGRILGVDISHPLLEVARARAARLPQVSFEEADAQVHPLPAGTFDGVFSRFGVMFFADPTAAFANIRSALKPGGRLSFVCWRSPAENPFMSLPMDAVADLLPPAPPPVPNAPGPFAFADGERVRSILEGAGFSSIELAPHDEAIGSGDLDQTLSVSLRVGPLGSAVREHPELRDAVTRRVRDALAAHQGPDGVKIPSASWMVTARA